MTSTFPLDTGGSPTALGDEELLAALRELEVARRRLYARQLLVIAELDARGVAQAWSYGGVASLVREIGNHNPGQARRIVVYALALNPSRAPSGAEIEAELPRTARVLGEGSIGADHVEAIRAALDALPRAVSVEDRSVAEEILCEAAVSSEPRIVTRLGREIRDRLDPDGAAPREKDLARPDRWLEVRQRPDGSVTGMFGLDAEAACGTNHFITTVEMDQ